jgi:hypothetical protein
MLTTQTAARGITGSKPKKKVGTQMMTFRVEKDVYSWILRVPLEMG